MKRETASTYDIRRTAGAWILALAVVLLAQCGHAPPEDAVEGAGVPVLFSYVDSEARRVCIAGSFNQWSTKSHCMTRKKNRWTVRVYLPPSRCAYQFVIDDKAWIPDPEAPLQEENGFGSRNSIVIVE